jgi:hypothetical protein
MSSAGWRGSNLSKVQASGITAALLTTQHSARLHLALIAFDCQECGSQPCTGCLFANSPAAATQAASEPAD